ncbi:hypothetical protein DFJ73DRAFT_788380 [Zopfochytrium polystomum]|nr:hypothetical protein DFJ73DRAFT_788380 [Zopfochytrium polystomum]
MSVSPFAALVSHIQSAASTGPANFYAYSDSTCTDASLGMIFHTTTGTNCQTFPCSRQALGPYVAVDCADGNFDQIAATRFGKTTSFVGISGFEAGCGAYAGGIYVRADGTCYTSGSKATDSGFSATISGTTATFKVYQNPTCTGTPMLTLDNATPLSCAKDTGHFVVTVASANGTALAVPAGTPSARTSAAAARPRSSAASLLAIAGVVAGVVASLAA